MGVIASWRGLFDNRPLGLPKIIRVGTNSAKGLKQRRAELGLQHGEYKA